MSTLKNKLEGLSVKDLARRPPPGKAGKKTRLYANVFPVPSINIETFYHYHVEIEGVDRGCRPHFDNFLRLHHADLLHNVPVAFDGRSAMFAADKIKLPNDCLEHSFSFCFEDDPERSRTFKIKIKKVAIVNMSQIRDYLAGRLGCIPSECFQALEVVLRNGPSSKMALVGRSFYTRANVMSLSGGVELWPGLFMSVRPFGSGLGLNADFSATAFIKQGPLLSIMSELIRQRNVSEMVNYAPRSSDRAQWTKSLRNVQIRIMHGTIPRKYRITGFSEHGCDVASFADDDGKKVTVFDYFKARYNLTLKYPKLPCVLVGQKKIFMPAEVCEIVSGQRYNKKLNEIQTADMIKFACKRPDERFRFVQQGVANLVGMMNTELQGFGIVIKANEPVQVEGRILPAPTVYYHPSSKEKSINPRDGGWNLKDKKFVNPQGVVSWGVVNFGRVRREDVENFVTALVRGAEVVGMNCSLRTPSVKNGDIRKVEESLKSAKSTADIEGKSSCQFILVILPSTDASLYSEIKRVGDTVLGVPTQCMQGKHAMRASPQYVANLCLKINAKLGGGNLSLERQLSFIVEKPTIVFGADVTHPRPGENAQPSIAAVVASLDPKMTKFASAINIQGPRVETIENLRAITKNLLLAFFRATKSKPMRILFYRDGVSEGQFSMVQDEEIREIKLACKDLEPNYEPKLTFVIVQKRHRLRFMNLDKGDTDRSGNARAGTVVDTGVVHPSQFDFYLYSHGGIQGTSRPTHYHVMQDENNFSSDELQQLTYWMCYTYARCTRSVSIVPPAYYAHLVAFRARMHAHMEDMSDVASQTTTSSDERDHLNRIMKKFAPVAECLNTRLYFI